MIQPFQTLREGLLGAWCPSIQRSGYTLTDMSTWRRNGTLTNMGGQNNYVADTGWYALAFDGSNDNVSFTPPSIADSPMTMAFWSRQSAQTAERHAFKIGTATTNNAFGIYRSATGLAWVCGLHATPSSEASFTIDSRAWMHVCGVLTPTSRLLYINGVNVATSSSSIAYNIGTTFGLIGSAQSTLVPWNGYLDDIRLYGRALTLQEIRLLATRPGIGLVPQRQRRYCPRKPWVNVGGTWKNADMYQNVGGEWKLTVPYVNEGGTWK